MKLLGLTGGIGMGKSACTTLLRQRAIPIVDTDILARELVEPGQPALSEIETIFGSEMIDSDGQLRRDLLATRVFNDPQARQQLESILHPRIRGEWKRHADGWRSEQRQCAVVVIPLLFETNAQADFDSIICVACAAATQRSRLSERGWSPQQISHRIAAQLPIEDKIARSDFVIWTEGQLDAHAWQLDAILRSLNQSSP